MKRDTKSAIVMSVLTLLMLPAWTQGHAQRWSEAKANAWYAQQPWLVGSNYVPTRTGEDKEADRGQPRSAFLKTAETKFRAATRHTRIASMVK